MSLLAAEYVLAAQMVLGASGLAQQYDANEVACLGLNVYHEARGANTVSQSAVAHVTLNRAKSSRFPDTICGVVTQGGEDRRKGCQFSWWCDGRSDAPADGKAFREALYVAVSVLKGRFPDPTDGATYFVQKRIRQPDWTRKLTRTVTLGGHNFYRY